VDAAAIIVAGGSSRRMGFDKLTAPICGKPVLAHSVAAFAACDAIAHIVVVAHPERIDQLREIAESAAAGRTPLTIVPGGSERQDSVQAGIAAAPAHLTLLAVHDGARPLVPTGAIARALDAARRHGAATLSHPVTDTLKRALPDGTAGEPVDRTSLHAMETPQCFQRALLDAAYAYVRKHGLTVTDEVSALQASGQTAVHLVDTRAPNPKITFPTDIPLAEVLLQAR
jgi:2-C-methyl-D-erythritol 4-phosphate cytidylyltransferase